jgi:SAM-dependent methyltransferase
MSAGRGSGGLDDFCAAPRRPRAVRACVRQTAAVSQTYGDVDASDYPAKAVAWQERMAAWPAVAAYKRRTYELLEASGRLLDVGCGPGDDVVALGVDRCVGVDRSVAMCERAGARGVRVVRSDGLALPFPDQTFDGARSDRVLQHVVDVRAALAELVRVVRPCSPLVVADPDQGSLVIEVPGVRPSVLQRLEKLRRDIGYRNGRWIADAPILLGQLGVDVTCVETFPLTIDRPADAFGLPNWPVLWRARGRFTDEELAEWKEAMNKPPAGFRYSVTFLVIAGSTVNTLAA